MATSRHYLSVPFAEKDQAKGLGAKWDPARKKWYVPAGLDLGLFARWDSGASAEPDAKAGFTPAASRSAEQKPSPSARIEPRDKHFVPYAGDIPPWE